MIEITNTEVIGWEHAIRGMRNPKDSWSKSDSGWEDFLGLSLYNVGSNDLKLMNKLVKAGSAHAKYKRMINVYCDVTSNHTWWAEFDTYEHTVRNSCSKMHTIHIKPFTEDMFSHEGIDEVGGNTKVIWSNYIKQLEYLRQQFNKINEYDKIEAKKYWRAIIDMLPMGFNITATIMLNYEVLTAIYRWRRGHKMFEWVEFCKWIKELPYSELITGEQGGK